jgi:isopentenyldiphosphate isomerase
VKSTVYTIRRTIHAVASTLLNAIRNLYFGSGVRNAAQRKLFDELGIQSEDLPVDQFIPLGKMLYKAPSDGKWGEHERKYLPLFIPDGFPVLMQFGPVALYF